MGRDSIGSYIKPYNIEAVTSINANKFFISLIEVFQSANWMQRTIPEFYKNKIYYRIFYRYSITQIKRTITRA